MAFIIITLLFFFFTITHIDNESAQINVGIITTILNKMFLKEKNIQVENTTSPMKESNIKCEINLSDCSLTLLLGLYISYKEIKITWSYVKMLNNKTRTDIVHYFIYIV
jgi:hypothetical protein